MILVSILLLQVRLELDLNPGTIRKYEVIRDYRSIDVDEQTAFHETVTFEVLKDKEEGRRKLTVSYLPKKTVLDGHSIPEGPGSVPLLRQEQRLSNGQVFLREMFPYEPLVRERQTRVLDLRFLADPIKVGSEWARDVPENKGDGIPPAHWTWTCEKIDEKSVTIRLAFAERECLVPITAEGTLTVDRKSGWYESVDVLVKNTVAPGDSEGVPANLKFIWKRL